MEDRYEAHELGEDECWDAMSRAAVGRVAFVIDGRPRLFPINFTCDGKSVLYRTSADSELAATRHAHVVFEVDGYDADRREAWSVILVGTGGEVTDPTDLGRATGLLLFPWHVGPKGLFIRITPEEITGRRFLTPYGRPA